MKLFHLSHIDLDGYGCQYLTSQVFQDTAYYNANYGPEVKARLKEIFQDIDADDCQECMILITDLNLSVSECNYIENQIEKSHKTITPKLLDHHITGKDSDERFDWYFLDTSRSATKITHDFLHENYRDMCAHSRLVQAINAIDIWIKDDALFEFGKVCMGMVEGAREYNRIVFPTRDRQYKFHLIAQAATFLDKGAIALDEAGFFIKKTYFLNGKNDILDNLVADGVVALLTENKESMSITYNGYKGILGYGIGKSSVIGNAFLVQNPEYNFYMDVSFRGKVSIRGNGTTDVSQMAQKLFGGGGHPNASGGKIEKFKESFVYDDIKKQIEDIMTAKA